MKKNTLFYKIFFTFMSILVLAVSSISYFGYKQAKVAYTNSAYDHNSQRTTELKTRIIKEMEPISKNILFLTSSYSLQSYYIWKGMKEKKKEKKYKQIFSDSLMDFLRTQKQYFKFSVIDLNAQEVLTAKYIAYNNKSFMVPQYLLENKNTRLYFKKAKKLTKGEFYISKMNLNMENREIEKPYIPIIKYATPIVDKNHQTKAIFVATMYAKNILNILNNMFQRDAKQKIKYYLLDSAGNYLFHEDKSFRWNEQLKNGHNFFNEYFNPQKYLETGDNAVFQKDNCIYSVEKVYPAHRFSQNFWYIVSSQDTSIALSGLSEFKLVFFTVLFLVVIIGTLLIRYFAKIVTEPIQSVSKKLKALSLGDMREEGFVSYEHDALGEAVSDLIHYVKNIQKQSEAITQGNLDYKVEVQSEYDYLGMSLRKMNNILKTSKLKTENDIWFSAGVGEFSESLSSSDDLTMLADEAISKICSYLGAQSGIVYKYNKKTKSLNQLGKYAALRYEDEINLGEGLIGQVAKDKKTIRIKDIDKHNYIVKSSLSEMKAKEIYIAPILYENKLFGVIEIATLQDFREIEISYIERVLEILSGIFHNTTQRVQIKNLLEDSKKSYEELQMQSEELERSSKYKSEFLANMSHELRTPLNSIILLSKLLSQKKSSSASSDEDRAKSAVINKAGNDLLLLINDILDLSKVESGNLELYPIPTSSIEIFGEINGLFSEVAKEKGLKFYLSDDYGSSFVADKTKLLQIIKNLLSNAFKFTKNGSVSMHLYLKNEKLYFEISDTGLGIAKEKLGLIFEAFKQVDGSISRNYGGTGLGLSISKSFIDLMEGKIDVESEEGKGSTFIISIPLVVSYESPKIEFMPSSIQNFLEDNKRDEMKFLKQHNVLIVDNDSKNIFSLSSLMQELGAETFSALDGQKAIELLQEQKIDLILMDLMMPVKDGLVATKEIKSNVKFKHIPIIMITAKTTQKDKKDSLEAGADKYLTKPIDQSALLSLINEVL